MRSRQPACNHDHHRPSDVLHVHARDDEADYLAGTIDYLAPEACCSRLRIDARSEVFSLGVVLFQLLTGRLPFATGTTAEAIASRLNDAHPDARALNPAVPLEVSQLVNRLTAREPLRRPQSAREVVDEMFKGLGQ